VDDGSDFAVLAITLALAAAGAVTPIVGLVAPGWVTAIAGIVSIGLSLYLAVRYGRRWVTAVERLDKKLNRGHATTTRSEDPSRRRVVALAIAAGVFALAVGAATGAGGAVLILGKGAGNKHRGAEASLTHTLASQPGRVFYISGASGQAVGYIMRPDGSSRLSVPQVSEVGSDLSPRENVLAEAVIPTGSKSDDTVIALYNLLGDEVRQLTHGPGNDEEPTWSPDGHEIAFIREPPHRGSGSGRENARVWIVNSSGRSAHPVSAPIAEVDSKPSFSPSGSQIAFACYPPGSLNDTEQLCITDVATGRAHAITNTADSHDDPAWSPNGKVIVYSLSGPHNIGDSELYAMSPSGRQIRRLTDRPGFNETPCWSPTGKYIVFVSGIAVDVMDLRTHQAIQVAPEGMDSCWR
jgi:Tol biopolymer transport system component